MGTWASAQMMTMGEGDFLCRATLPRLPPRNQGKAPPAPWTGQPRSEPQCQAPITSATHRIQFKEGFMGPFRVVGQHMDVSWDRDGGLLVLECD